MPDDNVNSSDSIGVVIKKSDGSKQIALGLPDAIDAMRDGKSDVKLSEIFRYIEELRSQRKTLLKERNVLQMTIANLQKRIKRYEQASGE